jgi:hypothetical protein
MWWVTSALDSLEHAVSDDEVARGLTAGTGEYRAVCGRVLLTQFAIIPPGRRCTSCTGRMRQAHHIERPNDLRAGLRRLRRWRTYRPR